MKTKIALLAVLLLFSCAFYVAKAQLGPGNMDNIESKLTKTSTQVTPGFNDDHPAVNPGYGLKPIPLSANDGLIKLQQLTAKQQEIIEAQKKRIAQLEKELQECQGKLKP